MKKSITTLLILLLSTSAFQFKFLQPLNSDTCKPKNCKECKEGSKTECKICEGGYFVSPRDETCDECDPNCVEGNCRDNLGCALCKEGYFINSFEVKEKDVTYKMQNCLNDRVKTWLYSFWGILLVFILGPITFLIVVILLIICLCCKARYPRTYDSLNNQIKSEEE